MGPLLHASACQVHLTGSQFANDVWTTVPGASSFLACCATIDVPITSSTPPYHPEDLQRAISKLSRSRGKLLVGGSLLAVGISQLVLVGLAEGFDVYLLWDTVEEKAEHFGQIYASRLHQAGAVPTTTFQVVSEWLVHTSEHHHRTVLSEYVKSCNFTEEQ